VDGQALPTTSATQQQLPQQQQQQQQQQPPRPQSAAGGPPGPPPRPQHPAKVTVEPLADAGAVATGIDPALSNVAPNAMSVDQQHPSREMTLPLRSTSKTTSAPTSPAKSRESLLQRVSSLTGVGRQQQPPPPPQHQQQHPDAGKLPYNKDHCLTLLVIDDQNTDWSKYFRGRKILGDWDVRVEQAEFSEITIAASSESGVHVSMMVFRNATKVVRSFQPDFVLVRQNMRDAREDHKSIILGLKYGGVPSINSLGAIYQFQDKPWIFGHLMEIQRRLGKEQFPLIEQTFYPNHREMTVAPRLPAVVKIGHAHGGLGKLRVETALDFQDAASVVAVSNTYCTVEPYIDSKFDIHVQKIGNFYKAFMRKSISGNWKTNMGSAMLEQTPMTDKYRAWIDSVAEQFGGLDLCALEILVTREGREIIMELNDCALPLLGDSQEEDRRLISELVLHRMNTQCRAPGSVVPATAPMVPAAAPAAVPAAAGIPATQSRHSVSSSRAASPEERSSSALPPSAMDESSMDGEVPSAAPINPVPQTSRDVLGGGNPFLSRRLTEDGTQGSAAGNLARSFFSRSASQQQSEGGSGGGGPDDGEDTMKNLRKTFAGIFGDM